MWITWNELNRQGTLVDHDFGEFNRRLIAATISFAGQYGFQDDDASREYTQILDCDGHRRLAYFLHYRFRRRFHRYGND